MARALLVVPRANLHEGNCVIRKYGSEISRAFFVDQSLLRENLGASRRNFGFYMPMSAGHVREQ